MNQNLINNYLRDIKADDTVISVLHKLPDEAFEALMYIKRRMEENGADWTTRQLQGLCREYLYDDKELMRLLDEDEKLFPVGKQGG